ncbi:MAG: DNA recombination protein RmuC, partial [Actinobacteria bacterium]|nr:DNA recombination protein RmuC [Actinomycetota bacterium]
MRGLEARLRDSDQRLGHALTAVQQMLVTAGAGSQETLSRLSQQLSEVGVTARQLAEQTQRLGELREALRAPGPRGGLGEVLLENLLRDVLPGGAYDTQFTFRDGTRVDAVVRLGDRLIPIDAKFPLTAFEPLVAAVTDDERRSARRRYLQAIRQHVDAVRRYVRPDEGTVP